MQKTPLAMDPHSDTHCEAEVDEPPERKEYFLIDSPTKHDAFMKSLPPPFARRESLLTRQLTQTEIDQHMDDEHHRARSVVRGMSTWSNPSVASTAELTSDNDMMSPCTRDSTPSPPLPATMLRGPVPMLDKIMMKEPVIVEQDEESQKGSADVPEKKVEATLGRPRCITFACGRKPSSNQANVEAPAPRLPSPVEKAPESPPPLKRKCTLTFACPTRPALQITRTQEKMTSARNISPPPKKVTRPPPSPKPVPKVHRGSDATVKNESPKSVRKIPSTIRRRKYSAENDDVPAEERRFHEFGPSEEEAEQWLEESGCHRRPLTVNDTLQKENIIRRIAEEVEEEALEEDEDEEALDDFEEDDEDIEDEEDDEIDAVDGASDDEVSDAGFDTDDEEGFAVSDSENDSDNEWWAPGRSTAATSTDHLEHIRPSRPRTHSQSSMESDGAEVSMPRAPHGHVKRKSRAVNIHRPGTPDLPDSTDFVCGTLDEDRPLEQAYISCLEQRKAAKHKARPQDIDPTFPTSDPEMDEEDDDDDEVEEKVEESDHPFFVQGKMDLNDEPDRRGRHVSAASQKKKSLSPPHQRLRSPPPAKRTAHRSPPPSKRVRSPPVPVKRTANKSPAPPRRLFGQSSPKRHRSPAPSRRVSSPCPSRSTSVEGTSAISFTPRATLAQRPQPTHTASLPRVASAVKIGKESPYEHDEVLEGLTTRGAIDIVKGLEKKRQRRKEKLYQKHCNRANKEPHRKPKPGKGAERMREVGLELAAYKGKREHMLSY